MKKFMGNLWVMIASLVIAVFTTVSLICVLAQPLFYVGDYYGIREYTAPTGDNYKNEQWVNVNADNTMNLKEVITNVTTGEKKEETQTLWYYKVGNRFFQIGDTETMTKEEYKDAVEQIKDMSDEEYQAYKDESSYVISFKAFYLSNESSLRESEYYSKYGIYIYKNSAKIPMVVTLSVIDTVLLAFAAISVTFFILNKKAKKGEPAPAETPAEETAEEPKEETAA